MLPNKRGTKGTKHNFSHFSIHIKWNNRNLLPVQVHVAPTRRLRNLLFVAETLKVKPPSIKLLFSNAVVLNLRLDFISQWLFVSF